MRKSGWTEGRAPARFVCFYYFNSFNILGTFLILIFNNLYGYRYTKTGWNIYKNRVSPIQKQGELWEKAGQIYTYLKIEYN